jgi:RNA polymerase sigma factor (sigma-70 family)
MVASEFKIKVLPVSRKLYRSALFLLKNEEDARDVVQDVFLKLWQKRGDLGQVENVEAFAMRMTRNRCIDILRSNRYVGMDGETDRQLREESYDVHSGLEVSEEALLVQKLMDDLPETQRQIMKLRDMDQLEYEEIAEVTGLQVNAIRVTLSRARKKVRDEFLKRKTDEDERGKTMAATLF